METNRKTYYREYYLKHRDKYLARSKAQRENNPEKVNEWKRKWDHNNPDYYKKYYSEDKYRERRREYYKKYYSEKYRERRRKYLDEHPKLKRASRLANHYREKDKKYNRYTGNNVTASWIVENIFSGQVCYFCGEDDWTKLGCDRIDNNLPHTEDNVFCACRKCNISRKRKEPIILEK